MWTYLIGLLLVATAVGGVWWTVTRTDYIPKLVVYLIKMAVPIIMKALTPKDLTEEQKQIVRQAGDIFRRKNQREK